MKGSVLGFVEQYGRVLVAIDRSPCFGYKDGYDELPSDQKLNFLKSDPHEHPHWFAQADLELGNLVALLVEGWDIRCGRCDQSFRLQDLRVTATPA